MTIHDDSSHREVVLNCIEDDYLHKVQYLADQHKDTKFSRPDFVYQNLYVVRFRNGLSHFFQTLYTQYPSLEIVLWTAAVRHVYTGLMDQVHRILTARIGVSQCTRLWHSILYRDNCSARGNGSYFKDLSLLNRNLERVVMIDNIWYNFEGFEYNGLPIIEYWGHCNDSELAKLERIMGQVLINKDVRGLLHRAAYHHRFSTYKLDSMTRYLNAHRCTTEKQLPSTKSMVSAVDEMETFEGEEVVDIHMEMEDMPKSSSENTEPADSFPSHGM